MAEYTEEADYTEEDYQGEGGEDYGEEGNFAEGDEGGGEDLDPNDMKKKVEEMEEELEKLTKMQQQVTDQLVTAADKVDENSM
jgi:hypothetical protein